MDNMAVLIVLGVFAGIGAITIIALAVTQAVVLIAGIKDRVSKNIAAVKEHNTAVVEDKKERRRMIMEKKQDIENLRTADTLARLEGKRKQKPVKTERSKFVMSDFAQDEQAEQAEQSEQEEVVEDGKTKAEIKKEEKAEKKRAKQEAKIQKMQEKVDKARAKAQADAE